MANSRFEKEAEAPQIKDSQVYEALRQDGASKEKAARIANAAARDGRATVGERGGESAPYEEWTVVELQKRAKEIDLSGYSELNKAELITLLREH